MPSEAFKRYNNAIGWACFLVASITYALTLEPTGSWWDCGEFMAAAYRLEVVHEPGSPLFILLGKLFSLAAWNAKTRAFFINLLSAEASAATVLFLFWTLTAFARKLVFDPHKPASRNQIVLVCMAGTVGALAYAFSDTFWFSAVESEVYALSSCFTAFVVWAMMKWEEKDLENPGLADRYILLIALAMGLSIGVHLLNLLTIPALTFIYYFRKFKPSLRGLLLTAVVSILLLCFVLMGVIPGVLALLFKVDIFTVNVLGLPYNLGAGLVIGVAIPVFVICLCRTRTKRWPQMHLAILALCFVLIGYWSYALVLIRAQANPPLNNSKPDNMGALYGYLAREQYEESPLVWGPDYTSEITGIAKGDLQYRRGVKGYESKGNKLNYTYRAGDTHVFPRVWSSEKSKDYAAWLGLPPGQKPSFLENIQFFFSYQLDFMYLRYFLWNFVGRQNDSPTSVPSLTQGNWLTGIHFLDRMRLGDQSALPHSMTANKAYNKLYGIPFLLGLLGLYYQLKRNRKGGIVVGLLFLCTGAALAVYLNMPPSQPRERDYAFAGSFYAFSIWIGLGVLWISHVLSRILRPGTAVWVAGVTAFMAVPVWMGLTEWDDHDRSTRTVVKDFAANYLNSCAPNAILFTYGDNETYPLWYAQEVEEIRRDIRVINLGLFDAAWCIDKAKVWSNSSPPLPISWNHEQYKEGVRDYLPVRESANKEPIELSRLLHFALREDSAAKDEDGDNFFASHRIKLSIDAKQAVGTGTIDPSEKSKVGHSMSWTFKPQNITKGQLIILDLINQNQWRRPIYFCWTSGSENFLGLDAYLRLEGITLRLIPIEKGRLDTHQSYSINRPMLFNHLVHRFRWGNVNGPIHLDDQTNSFTQSFKEVFYALEKDYADHQILDSCLLVLEKERAVLPVELPPLGEALGEEDFQDQHRAALYYLCHKPSQGREILGRQLRKIEDELRYYNAQSAYSRDYFSQDRKTASALLTAMAVIARTHHETALEASIQKALGSARQYLNPKS